jgi:hypothetical protein
MTIPSHPTGARMPEVRRPPVPSQVAIAVRAMYAGALASIVGIVIEIVTVNATKTAIEKRSRHLSARPASSSPPRAPQ